MSKSHDLFEQLAVVSYGIQRVLRETAQAMDLEVSPFQARLISFFRRFPDATPHSLAEVLSFDKAQIARAIKQLEAQGLVQRSRHPDDGRSIRIHLTASGIALSDRLASERNRIAERLLGGIDRQELESLGRSLAQMRTALDL